MSIGSTLREARERKGLTIEEVAERTRMIHQMVDEMEHDDFHRVAAAIYGRGFIKLYSECVEIDPAPLLAEFNEVYTGFRKAPPEGEPAPKKSRKPAMEADTAAPEPDVKAEAKPTPQPSPKASESEAPKVEEVVAAAPAAPAAADATPVAEAQIAEPVTAETTDSVDGADVAKDEDTPSTNVAEALGELFDVGRRDREEAVREAASKTEHEEPAHINLPLTEEAPSWDDAPLVEGDMLHRLLERMNIKVAIAAVAAVFVCAVLILVIVISTKPSTPQVPDGDSASASPTADVSDDAIDPYTTRFAPPPDTYVK